MSATTHGGNTDSQTLLLGHCTHLTFLPNCSDCFDLNKDAHTQRRPHPPPIQTINKLDSEPSSSAPASPNMLSHPSLGPESPHITNGATRTPRPPSIPFFPGPIHDLLPSRWYDDDELSSSQDTEAVDFSDLIVDSSCETSFASGEDTSFSSSGHSIGGGAGDESYCYSDENESANTSLSLSSLGGCGGAGIAGVGSGERLVPMSIELFELGIFGLDEDLVLRLSSLGVPHSQLVLAEALSKAAHPEKFYRNRNTDVKVEGGDGEDNVNLDHDIAMPYASFSGHILTSIPECDFEFDDDDAAVDSSVTGSSEGELSWLCSPSPSPTSPSFPSPFPSEYPRDPLHGLRESMSGQVLAGKGHSQPGVRLRASTYPSSISSTSGSSPSALVSLSSLRG